MFNEVIFVGQHFLGVDKTPGWRCYRIEYYMEDKDYKQLECSILLPVGFDALKLSDEINLFIGSKNV